MHEDMLMESLIVNNTDFHQLHTVMSSLLNRPEGNGTTIMNMPTMMITCVGMSIEIVQRVINTSSSADMSRGALVPLGMFMP